MGLACGFKQGDHVVAVAQVGGKFQRPAGVVIHRIESHVGHNLAGAGANWDTAVATIHLDELPQQRQRVTAIDVTTQLGI